MRGHYSVHYRDYLNLGVAGKELPEKDDRVQPGEEAGEEHSGDGWEGT